MTSGNTRAGPLGVDLLPAAPPRRIAAVQLGGRHGPATLLVAAAAGSALGLGLLAGAVALHPVVVVAAPVLLGVVAVGLRRPAWALLPFVAVLPIGSFEVADLDIVQLVAVATVGLVVGLRLLRGERVLLVPPHAGWAVAILGVLVVAAATGPAADRGIGAVVLLATGLALAAAIGTVTSSPRDLQLALVLLLVVAGAMCVVATLDVGTVDVAYGGAVVEGRSQGTFSQPNELGTFSAMTVLLALGALASGVRRLRVPAAVAAVAGLLATAASLSRAAWIGVAVGLLAVVVLRPGARRFVAGSLAGVALSVTVAVPLAPDLPQVEVLRARAASLANPASNPFDDRPAIYREALRQVNDAPWFGNGPAAFPVVAARNLDNGARVAPSHAHNTLLVAASEGGLLTAGLLVGFSLAVGRAARRRLRSLRARGGGSGDRVREAAVLGAASSLVVLVGQGMFDYTLRNPTLLLTAAAMLGLLLTALRDRA